jgi:DNA repair protein RecO (recombination protein O)
VPGRRVQRTGQEDCTKRAEKRQPRGQLRDLGYNALVSAQERTLQTEALVLRHQDWGEADRLLWLYTKKEGKLRAVAKGARKIHSRKAGHLEPFTRSSLLLARGRDFWIVTQAETIDAYLHLKDDLARVGYASYVIELLDRFTFEGEDNQDLYHLVRDTLSRLADAADPAVPLRYYEIHLLDLLGYRPRLYQCMRCGREIEPEDQFFSIDLGGALCPDCGPLTSGARPIALGTLRYLRHFQRSSFSAIAALSLSPEMNRQLEQFMANYFTYHLEHALNTPDFIRRVKSG